MAEIAKIVSEKPTLCVVFVLILIFLSLAVGYSVGLGKTFRKGRKKKGSGREYEGRIQTLIIDHLNLGVIAYNTQGAVYTNNTIYDLPGFLNTDKDGEKLIPKDINSFVAHYDKDNHLQSDYILSGENDDSVIRANYKTGKKIYEIKILKRDLGDDRFDIVIIDDITQIKDDERRQKDLAANVSHELKTPLTVIRASELFVNNVRPDNMPSYDEIKKWGGRVVTNAVRMQDIVQDFLTLSMASSSVPMNIIDVYEAANKAVMNISDYPGRDRVNIRLPEASSYPLVFGNANLVMRVIINMLTNAVKYISYEGKTVPDEITVSIEEIDERIAVQVTDNGRGIPKKDIDHLFERFYRVDNSGSRDVGGSGIGLSIAKDVADMHDGTITVISEEGNGSTFTLSLPKAKNVFENVYEDAKTGVVSENTYYRCAADFMGMQITEAARSMGYSDVLKEAEELEGTSTSDKMKHDRKLVELFGKIGDERYNELVEELTFTEDPDEGDEVTLQDVLEGTAVEDNVSEDLPSGESDSLYDSETAEAETEADGPLAEDVPQVRKTPEISAELMTDLKKPAAPSEEDEIRRKKEEARKLLTQPILPRAVKEDGAVSTPTGNTGVVNIVNSNKKETVTIHPNFEKKMYNVSGKKSGKKKAGLFEGFSLKEKTPEEPEVPEIRSAVKLVLDEAETIRETSKEDQEEE